MGAAHGQYLYGFHHAGDMPFVIATAQALDCAADLRQQDGDSADRYNRTVWPNVGRVPVRSLGTKKEQIRI